MSRIATLLLAAALAGCNSGTLGDVLGGVLNAPANQNQVSGYVQGVDTRSQTLFVRMQDGSTLSLAYDSRTQVVYQNQVYSPTALENGDQITARIQSNGNNNYYTDRIDVVSSVSSNTSTSNNGSVYSITGNVRSIDTYNGWFTMDTNNGVVTISLPYNARSSDVDRFRNLRNGDYVRVSATYLSGSRYELRQFM